MPLDKNAVRFAVAVACLAEGLLGEKAGPDAGDGCPQGDPECLAAMFDYHDFCRYTWRGADPDPRTPR